MADKNTAPKKVEDATMEDLTTIQTAEEIKNQVIAAKEQKEKEKAEAASEPEKPEQEVKEGEEPTAEASEKVPAKTEEADPNTYNPA